jgi:hypothetical protein
VTACTTYVHLPQWRVDLLMTPVLPWLTLQNQDYRVQYDALQRVFVLPKPHSPHTLVVAALDPPIRKGQTHYAHVLAHFHTDEEVTLNLEMTQEQIDAKNEKVDQELCSSLTQCLHMGTAQGMLVSGAATQAQSIAGLLTLHRSRIGAVFSSAAAQGQAGVGAERPQRRGVCQGAAGAERCAPHAPRPVPLRRRHPGRALLVQGVPILEVRSLHQAGLLCDGWCVRTRK